jgi:hypothetical protein
MSPSIFKVFWETIQRGDTWQGKVKNQAKDGTSYYVNATVLPLYNDANQDIVEYMGIRFVTTDEEVEKREFKRRVLRNIQDTKKKNIKDLNKIKELEEQLKNLIDVDLHRDIVEKEKKKSSMLSSQIAHYEIEVKALRKKYEIIVARANEKVKKASETAFEQKNVNNNLSFKVSLLKQETNEKGILVKELNKTIIDQNKLINNLRDVIEDKRKELDKLKTSSLLKYRTKN